MVRVLIVEDEPLAAQKLQYLLPLIDARLHVEGIVGSVFDAVKWLTVNSVDLLFLDINLSDDQSFKIFEKIHVVAPVIFVTAYDQFAIKAFKNNGIDYILKPFDEEELRKSITNFFKLNSNNIVLQQDMQQILASFKGNDYRKRLLLSFGDKSKTVLVEDVAFFYTLDKGVFLTTRANQTYLTNDTLDSLELTLDDRLFFRINRKILVSVNCITEVVRYSSRQLKVICNPIPKFDVVVPADKISDFKNWLSK